MSSNPDPRNTAGFVSYEAKIYVRLKGSFALKEMLMTDECPLLQLEDVIDHVESTLSSLDLFSSLSILPFLPHQPELTPRHTLHRAENLIGSSAGGSRKLSRLT